MLAGDLGLLAVDVTKPLLVEVDEIARMLRKKVVQSER